jgi:hypothetical protein
MAQIGNPERIVTVEPLYEPLPGRSIPDVEEIPTETPKRIEEPIPVGGD